MFQIDYLLLQAAAAESVAVKDLQVQQVRVIHINHCLLLTRNLTIWISC